MDFNRILNLSELLRQKSCFLFGARATGKTTLIEKQLPGAFILNLLDDEVYERLLRRPKVIEESLTPASRIIVIDEVQRLPKLLNEVQRLMKRKELVFLLTGSSARNLKRGGANLLGGRAWEAHLHPLTFHEIPNFDLLRYLNVGGLPAVYLSRAPQEELKSYVSLYLREEVFSEALVRKEELFLRFLDVIALNNGEELHYQGLSNDSGVQAKTIQNYVQILEDTLIGFQVLPFLATKKRKAISRSKFFFFDLGVVNRLARRSEILEGSEIFGKAFEHFVARELRSYLSYRRHDEELCYWRSTSGFEVDFVIGREIAIEVKSTEMVVEGHLKGLKALREEGLVKKSVVVSQDPEKRVLDGVEILPWKVFLQQLWSDQLL